MIHYTLSSLVDADVRAIMLKDPQLSEQFVRMCCYTTRQKMIQSGQIVLDRILEVAKYQMDICPNKLPITQDPSPQRRAMMYFCRYCGIQFNLWSQLRGHLIKVEMIPQDILTNRGKRKANYVSQVICEVNAQITVLRKNNEFLGFVPFVKQMPRITDNMTPVTLRQAIMQTVDQVRFQGSLQSQVPDSWEKLVLEDDADVEEILEESEICPCCLSQSALTYHHLIPRSVQNESHSQEEKTRIISICRRCHDVVHRTFSNIFLAVHLNTKNLLLGNKLLLQKFCRPPLYGPRQSLVDDLGQLLQEGHATSRRLRYYYGSGDEVGAPLDELIRRETGQASVLDFLEELTPYCVVPLTVGHLMSFWTISADRRCLGNFTSRFQLEDICFRIPLVVWDYVELCLGHRLIGWTRHQLMKFLASNVGDKVWFFLFSMPTLQQNWQWLSAVRVANELMATDGVVYWKKLCGLVAEIDDAQLVALGWKYQNRHMFPRLQAVFLQSEVLVEIALSLSAN